MVKKEYKGVIRRTEPETIRFCGHRSDLPKHNQGHYDGEAGILLREAAHPIAFGDEVKVKVTVEVIE